MKYFTALGRNRVFRALVRLSDAAIGALALIYLTAVQLLCAVAQLLGRRVARGLAAALRTP